MRVNPKGFSSRFQAVGYCQAIGGKLCENSPTIGSDRRTGPQIWRWEHRCLIVEKASSYQGERPNSKKRDRLLRPCRSQQESIPGSPSSCYQRLVRNDPSFALKPLPMLGSWLGAKPECFLWSGRRSSRHARGRERDAWQTTRLGATSSSLTAQIKARARKPGRFHRSTCLWFGLFLVGRRRAQTARALRCAAGSDAGAAMELGQPRSARARASLTGRSGGGHRGA